MNDVSRETPAPSLSDLEAAVEAKHAELAEATNAYVTAAHASGMTQLAVQATLMRIMVPPA